MKIRYTIEFNSTSELEAFARRAAAWLARREAPAETSGPPRRGVVVALPMRGR